MPFLKYPLEVPRKFQTNVNPDTKLKIKELQFVNYTNGVWVWVENALLIAPL